MKVETYNLQNSKGKHIRKATRVIFDDHKQINFIEKLGKKDAIVQALKLRNRKSILASNSYR